MHFHTLAIALFVAGISFTAGFPVADSGLLGSIVPGGGIPIIGGIKVRSPKKETPQFINSDQSTTQNGCNVGTAQCCQSLHQSQDVKSQGIFGALGLLGIELPLDDLFVGIQCAPVAGLIGLAATNACHSTPVCCTGNTYDGLVNLGCSPVSLN